MTPTALIQMLHRLEPVLRQQVVTALAQRQGAVRLDALTAALRTGDLRAVDAILAQAPLTSYLGPVDATLRETYTQGTLEGLYALRSTQAAVVASLTRTNPLATAAARFSASRVTNISEVGRAAVQDLITGAFEDGTSVRDTAQLLRSVVGLSARDAGAVENYRDALVERGTDAGEAVRLADKYATRLTAARATTIARTEILEASHAGQQALWQHGVESGTLSADLERAWLVGPDPCDDCADMEDETTPLLEPFDTVEGPLMYPPLHPRCVCSVGIVRD